MTLFDTVYVVRFEIGDGIEDRLGNLLKIALQVVVGVIKSRDETQII